MSDFIWVLQGQAILFLKQKEKEEEEDGKVLSNRVGLQVIIKTKGRVRRHDNCHED